MLLGFWIAIDLVACLAANVSLVVLYCIVAV